MEIVNVTATPSSACPNRTPRPLWCAAEHLQPNADECRNGSVKAWRPAVLVVFADERERTAWLEKTSAT